MASKTLVTDIIPTWCRPSLRVQQGPEYDGMALPWLGHITWQRRREFVSFPPNFPEAIYSQTLSSFQDNHWSLFLYEFAFSAYFILMPSIVQYWIFCGSLLSFSILFLRFLKNVYGDTTLCLYIQQWMGFWILNSLGQVWIMLQWILTCDLRTYDFVSFGCRYLGVELLGCMLYLCLTF